MLNNKEYGDKLNAFNAELQISLKNLCTKKEKLGEEINFESQRKIDYAMNLNKLKSELSIISTKLETKKSHKKEIDLILNNTQSALIKILDNTRALNNILKKDESMLINKKEKSGNICLKS